MNYSLFLFLTLIALLVVKKLDISYPLTITTTTKSTELAVVGEGKVEVIPDTAYIDVGISVNNVETADKAQEMLSSVNNKIIEAVKKLGIVKEDIKTANYSVYPNYSYEEKTSKITGYNGNATVTIKVKEMKLTSQVITEATNVGANQIHGVRFEIDKPEKYREQARDKAIENAREQAEQLAKKLGIKLGRVVNIVESAPERIYPLYGKAIPEAGGGGPQIEPGSQTITSTVTLYFEKY